MSLTFRQKKITPADIARALSIDSADVIVETGGGEVRITTKTPLTTQQRDVLKSRYSEFEEKTE